MDSSGVMESDKWGHCQDERLLGFDGTEWTDAFCKFPFILNGSYYDECTREETEIENTAAIEKWNK